MLPPGVVMADQLYSQGPQDGSVIGVPINGLPTAPLLQSGTQFDATRLVSAADPALDHREEGSAARKNAAQRRRPRARGAGALAAVIGAFACCGCGARSTNLE